MKGAVKTLTEAIYYRTLPSHINTTISWLWISESINRMIRFIRTWLISPNRGVRGTNRLWTKWCRVQTEQRGTMSSHREWQCSHIWSSAPASWDLFSLFGMCFELKAPYIKKKPNIFLPWISKSMFTKCWVYTVHTLESNQPVFVMSQKIMWPRPVTPKFSLAEEQPIRIGEQLNVPVLKAR